MTGEHSTPSANPTQEQRFAIIEVTVKPRKFRVKVLLEDWESWDHSERLAWCEEVSGEFDKLHFDHVFVERST